MAVLSSTFAVARQGFLKYTGNWYGGTTTGAGAADATTLVDSTLAIYPNNAFNTFWAMPTSGTYSGQIRRVSVFTSSTGTVTVSVAYGGQILGSITYELCKWHPTNDILQALNEVLLEVLPWLGRAIINDDLISGNWLPNGEFRDWGVSSHPDYWVAATLTAAKDTTIFKFGTGNTGFSAKLTGGASSGYIGCEAFTGGAVIWLPLIDLSNQSIDFEVWAKTSSASHIRIGIVDPDGTTYSGYHTGGNYWELLKATRTIKSGAGSVAFRIYADVNAAVGYVQRARAIGPTPREYILPSVFPSGRVANVSLQSEYGETPGDRRPCDDVGSNALYTPINYSVVYDDTKGYFILRLPENILKGYKLRLEGQEYFATGSADTDTIPLNAGQLCVVYCKAMEILSRKVHNAQEEAHYHALFNSLKIIHRLPQPALRASFGNWKY